MFSISHPSPGTFRLEIHAPPSELDPESARRLRAVLLGLAEEIRNGADGQAVRESPSPPAPPKRSREREAAG